MRYVTCCLAALSGANLGAQTPQGKLQFEVASVKAAVKAEGGGRAMPPMMREMMRNNRPVGAVPMPDPGRIHLTDSALLDLVAMAYSVRANQVLGPAWMGDLNFDIDAKLPEGARREDVNAMLQALLEERFGLKIHRDAQTKQGYALVVGKNGPKLKAAEPPPAMPEGLTDDEKKAKQREQTQAMMAAMQKRMQENRENGSGPHGPSRSSSWGSTTMAEMASRLTPFTDAPVVDETGLTGRYSVSIETWENAETPGGTIFDAVEKLGLKLEARKITLQTVVVDAVSKTPTAN